MVATAADVLERALMVFHTPERVSDHTLVPMLCGRADASFFTSHQPALLTVSRLAPGLPRYRVTFDRDGALAVDVCEPPARHA